VHHGNIVIRTPEDRMQSEPSPWAQVDLFTPLPDDLWQDIMNTSFGYLADDSLLFFDIPEAEQPNESYQSVVSITEASTKDAEQSAASLDVDMVLNSLPACGFCRSQHMKCDQKFPACGSCSKSSRECKYYDAVLKKHVLRRSVPTLNEATVS
jgi:hypothetical protein